jgi:hypothetical protein
METQLVLLLRLVAAHMLADFVLAPLLRSRADGENGGRRRAARPYIHGLLAAGLTYLVAGLWGALWLMPVVFAVHVVSDLAGPGNGRRSISFPDQALHLVVLLVVWFILLGPGRGGALGGIAAMLQGQGFWIVAVAYGLVIWPCAEIVGRVTQRWRDEAGPLQDSLAGAGLWIGRLERVLIVTFVLLNRFEAVGFLAAAKSILRIGEVTGHNAHRQAEYILVGTMASLVLAITIGVVAARLLA